MPSVSPALRWEVLRALDKAAEDVAHGHPSLQVAFHYLRLTKAAWAEVDKALDAVRFDVRAELLEEFALSEGGHSSEGQRLRDRLAVAEGNGHLPWESPEGHTRRQCVALLFIARELAKRLPVVGAGPLLPSLPLTRSTS
ncbi:hypothetical protein [Hyalangium minutum]|uniref:Uncharacterized protein n=1 Tax=Hyalangium minutum TaxID=394096 RepID=A0A085VXF1_9BACT|nr:hypothetical protein [Hyalangium minutum]KFE60114.1 hypothetical protein DB31_5985 [Hyalangium minutum]